MITKKLRHTSIAALVGVPTLMTMQLASTAQAASGVGSYSYPAGQIIYTFTTPAVSIYGAVQVGDSPAANVNQNSARNIAVVGQVGNTPSAKVRQIGYMNYARVTQVGQWTNALTIQFGNVESLIGP